MTPSTAATILGVPVTATEVEVEAAYRRRSRASHPDRFAGEPAAVTSTAAAEFVRVTEARETMMRALAARSGSDAAIPLPYPGYEVASRPRRSWPAFGAWATLLVVALVISVLDDSAQYSTLDVVFRLIPLGISAVAFALTGRRVWMVLAILFAVASVALTLAIASFGPLISLEFLLVPLLGLGALGLRRMRAVRR